MLQKPFVSIIIVNYNGRHLMDDCLGSLQTINYPKAKYEIIVVDNNSHDDSVSYLKKKFPTVKLIESKKNIGFSGGNNLGYEHAKGEYIVLLNSDTKVTPNWLSALVKTAQSSKNIGLVSSKLLYATPFIELSIESQAICKSEFTNSIDFSPMGVMVEEITCRNEQLQQLVWYQSGFYQKKDANIITRWTNGQGKILLPFVSQKAEMYQVTLHGYPTKQKISTPIAIKLGVTELISDQLHSNQVKQYSLSISHQQAKPHLIWLVQNAGNEVLHDGYSKDRGSIVHFTGHDKLEFYERDSVYFNQPRQLSAVCGASFLIKKKVAQEISLFDGHYFMYYEDVDLSFRAWRMGWDIVYCPESIVYHKHRATTGTKLTPFILQVIEKNHLFFLVTHFPLKTVALEFVYFLARFMVTALKTIVFRFSQDLDRYNTWRQRLEGRSQALMIFLKHLPRLIGNRYHWQQLQKRQIQKLINTLY